MIMDVANVLAPPVESWTLGMSLGSPFTLASGIFATLFVAIWATPESRTESSRHFASEAANNNEERTTLLQGSSDTSPSTTAIAVDGTALPNQQQDSWRESMAKLAQLARSRNILILFACSFLKRIALFSETFFVQYASEKYRLPYRWAAWFNGVQAAGAIVALGVLLPLATHYLQRHINRTWVVDRLLAQLSLVVLVLGYASVWFSGNVVLFAAGKFHHRRAFLTEHNCKQCQS